MTAIPNDAPMEPPSGYIDYELSASGSPNLGQQHGDPLMTARGSLATWDWLTPQEALAGIAGMLDASDSALLNAGSDKSLLPNDVRITITIAYRDADEPELLAGDERSRTAASGGADGR